MRPRLLINRAFQSLVAFAFLSLASVSMAADAEDKIERTLPANPGGTLTIQADRGSIEVRPQPISEVRVLVERRVPKASPQSADAMLQAHRVEFASDAGNVRITAELDREFARKARSVNLQVQYVVQVPDQYNLDLQTAAGDISCGDITGAIKARDAGGSITLGKVTGSVDANTSAGNVEVQGASGAISARTAGGNVSVGEAGSSAALVTSAGSIRIETARARLTAKTSGGNIAAGDVGGPAELETSAGSIQVKLAEGPLQARTAGGSITLAEVRNTVDARTSAGSIRASFAAQPEGDCRLVTSGGSVEVSLDPELEFDLEAETAGGRISTDVPVAVVGEQGRGRLRGKVNGGGKALTLKTSAGSVSIRKR